MKNMSVVLLLLLSFNLEAQEKIMISETRIGINTIQGSTVSVDLIFDMQKGYRHRTIVFESNNPEVTYSLKSVKQNEVVSESESAGLPLPGNNFVGFQFETTETLMNKILKGTVDYYIEITDTIVIEIFMEGGTDTLIRIITPDQVKDHTRNKITISTEQRDELILAAGGELAIKDNKFDIGFIPSAESNSGKTEYYTNFNYRKGYPFIRNAPVYLEVSGLLSTNIHDSLNYVRLYPLSFNLFAERSEINLQAGIEGNQTFSNYRVSGNVNWQGLLPNLVDLTYGANRLRLKPVLQAGLKIFREIDNDRLPGDDNNVFAGIAYARAFYYIPVYDIYSLAIEGNVFYTPDTDINPQKEIKYLYSITLGMEIKGSGIKTILKYVNGENDINYEKNSAVMLGIMADLFRPATD